MIAYPCDVCSKDILDADGYIHLSIRELAASERRWAELENEDGSVTLGVVELTADVLKAVRWKAYHIFCDPDPDAQSYTIQIEQIRTIPKLLAWTLHLMEKAWLPATNWDAFAEAAALKVCTPAELDIVKAW